MAPVFVGDITAQPMMSYREDDTVEVVTPLSDLEAQAKGTMNHSILSRKGFVPYSTKKVNQDRPVIKYAVGGREDISMFGVMDGHGEFGHLVSQFVKDKLPVYLGKHIDEVAASPEAGIQHAVADMCAELKKTQIDCAFSGTTCVFGVRIGDQLHVANIGDSRCVMLQKDAAGNVKSKDLSEDHKPESPGEKERIIAAGGRVKTLPGPPGEDCGPMRVWLGDVEVPGLAMSRSIGDEVSQQVGVISVPEVIVHDLVAEDRMVVWASDGVWEFISNEEVAPTPARKYYINH